MLKEFKEFAIKGNMLDMAVGVIIGSAFSGLVTASVVAYGSFISQVLNFLIMAFVVFLFVKTINRMRERGKKEEVPAAPTVKKCPYCLSEIPVAATRCAHCTSQLTDEEAVTEG